MGYHLNVKFVSRGKGQSLVAKGAYQARAKFLEERTGEYKNYTYKNDGPVKSFIFVDKKHGPEFQDIESLLNAIDRSETRTNAQTGLNFTVALPKELTDEERAHMLRDFGREEFLRKGIPAIAHIHPPHESEPVHDNSEQAEDALANNRNHHAHILAGLRTLGPDGQFGDKHITWDNYNERLGHWRERWAELGARYLENAGHKIEAERWRYGHLTNPQQREKALERGDREWAEIKSKEAGKHRGPNADAMERKGIETELGNAAREILQHNEDRATLHALKRDLARLERREAFEKLKRELTKSDEVLAKVPRAERQNRPPRLDELNSQIFRALLHEAIRNPNHLEDVQTLAWRMPGNFAIDLGHAVAEIDANRHLGLNDIAKLMSKRERHSLDYQRAELDALRRLRSHERSDVPLADAEKRMDAAQHEIAELDPRIYNGLLSHLICTPERSDEIHMLAQRLPNDLLTEFHEAVEEHERVRNFELADIKKLVAAHERQGLLDAGAEIKKLADEHREREYARRDPVRDQIAWEDGVAKAAIEKEKKDQRFLAKEDREKETRARGKQVAPELGATQAQIRLARVLSPGPQSFANALEDRGLILACMTEADAARLNRWEGKRLGDKATYKAGELAVVNQYGDIFSLTPRNTGLNRDELPEYLKGIDRAPLLGISAAQNVANAARQHQRQEKQEIWEQKRAAASVKFGDVLLSRAVKIAMRDPRQQHGEPVSGAVFRDALEQHRLALACVTPEEASRSYREYREAQFAKELERDRQDYAPVYQAGEVVVVREQRKDGLPASRVHRLSQTKAEDYLHCLGIDRGQLQGIEATKQTLDDRAKKRQRAIEAAEQRKARGPQRGGLAAQERWAMQRVREAGRQRQQQPYHPEEHAEKHRRQEQEYRQRQDEEKRKRDAGDQLDAERYRTDPEYRRQVQQTQEWKSPEDKQRDRENAARASLEQQDRGR